MAILAALATVAAGFIAGGILLAAGHVVIGVAVMFASLPFGIAVWIKISDRM